MQRWGKTKINKQRWRCPKCQISCLKTRLDTKDFFLKKDFIRWLLGNSSLAEVASKRKINKRSLIRQFNPFWQFCPLVLTNFSKKTANNILIVDGVYFYKRECGVLIVRTKTKVLNWQFVNYESSETWLKLFKKLSRPDALVGDGQKGMILAAKTLWPAINLQRCLAHLMRSEQIYLTRNPKTEAGKQLLTLVKQLPRVWTRRQKRRWCRRYFQLFKQHRHFLKERSYYQLPNEIIHWWYTHKNLRSAFYLIKHSLPYMFTYVGHYDIPRTSNYVEGGINSRLKELLRRHRGLSIEKKKVLVSYFLLSKQH